MFQFTGSPSAALWIYAAVTRVFRAGFPHSDIRGSRCICHSPRLFAACHVFHRLLVPRHPPCALTACPASAIHLAINKWPLKSLLNSFLRKEKTSSFDVFSYLILCIQFSRCDTNKPCDRTVSAHPMLASRCGGIRTGIRRLADNEESNGFRVAHGVLPCLFVKAPAATWPPTSSPT